MDSPCPHHQPAEAAGGDGAGDARLSWKFILMIAAVFLVLAGFALWMLFFIIQFAALLSLLALALGLVMTAAVYGFSFLGFYYLFGEPNTGWAIFAAIFLGSVILSVIAKSIKQWLNRNEAAPRNLVDYHNSNARSEEARIMTHEKNHPIYSNHADLEKRGGILIVERQGKRPKYYCFACQACGFKFTRVIPAGLFCPSCGSLKIGRDPRIRM